MMRGLDGVALHKMTENQLYQRRRAVVLSGYPYWEIRDALKEVDREIDRRKWREGTKGR